MNPVLLARISKIFFSHPINILFTKLNSFKYLNFIECMTFQITYIHFKGTYTLSVGLKNVLFVGYKSPSYYIKIKYYTNIII